jgi:Zn-dependent protease with chaperone function
MAPFAELAVPLPYFVILLGCWLIYYDAERELHRAAGSAIPFWPRSAYLLHNARNFAIMVFLPVGLIVTKETIGRYAPETTHTLAYRIGTLCVVPCLILLMPLVMKPLLGLKSMPAGPTRTRFEELAKRLNFRCRDFLVWHTHGASTNAFITGLIPQVRYVVFTDRILEDLPPEELDAVFGHEVGHAKHGHIWFYMAFLTLSLSVLAASVLFAAQQIDAATSPQMVELRIWLASFKSWLAIPPVLLVALYLFVVFGALSRRCERQADLFGAKAVSCGTPVCDGHTTETEYPAGGQCLCRTGLLTCAQALDRVRELNGLDRDTHESRSLWQRLRSLRAWMRAWQHGPMPRRIAYLRNLTDKLAEERRFQRRVFAFKCLLILLLVSALVALGEAVGWQELFDSISV